MRRASPGAEDASPRAAGRRAAATGLGRLRRDPLGPLLGSDNPAIPYFVRRDLLAEDPPRPDMKGVPEVALLLRKQQADGSWVYPGKQIDGIYPPNRYALLETWKRIRFLVERYERTREDPAVARASEFLLSFQAEEGDIRGLLANQHAMYYTGAILAILIRAGYAEDPRIERGMQWLLTMRQDDGGWIGSPLLAVMQSRQELARLTTRFAEPLPLDRSKPSSHNWTGMAIRAFAAHPRWRKSKEAAAAARLLKAKFFQEDVYTSYKSAAYWTRFEFPFWWNNLVAAMDSISRIGADPGDADVERALAWFVENQRADGLWDLDARKPGASGGRTAEMRPWVGLAVCRVLARFRA
jgi:hypothetical protein